MATATTDEARGPLIVTGEEQPLAARHAVGKKVLTNSGYTGRTRPPFLPQSPCTNGRADASPMPSSTIPTKTAHALGLRRLASRARLRRLRSSSALPGYAAHSADTQATPAGTLSAAASSSTNIGNFARAIASEGHPLDPDSRAWFFNTGNKDFDMAGQAAHDRFARRSFSTTNADFTDVMNR